MRILGRNIDTQEYIQLGCVLPACWPYPVVSHVSVGRGGLPNPSWRQTPLDGDSPGCRSPLSYDLWYMLGSQPPCGQKEWHMPVKTLPCPKLRLRAVKNLSNSEVNMNTEVCFFLHFCLVKEIYTASVVELSFVLESHAAITNVPTIQQMSCKFDIVEMGSCWNTNSPVNIHRARVMLNKPIINTCYLHIYLRATTLVATSSPCCIKWYVWQSVASFNIKW